MFYPSTWYICDFVLFHIEIEGKSGWIIWGRGGGGQRVCWPPPPKLLGGLAPLATPPLPTPMIVDLEIWQSLRHKSAKAQLSNGMVNTCPTHAVNISWCETITRDITAALIWLKISQEIVRTSWAVTQIDSPFRFCKQQLQLTPACATA